MLQAFLRRSIIHRFIPPRSPFDKTNFIPNYEPPRLQKHVRQAKWDDPSYNWPPKLEKTVPLKGKALVAALELEYVKSIDRKFPEIRTGDLIEVSCYYSLSSQSFNTFRGLCIARRKRNKVSNSLNVIGVADGIQMEMHIKLHSPLVKEIKVVEHGAGDLRARLNYFRGLKLYKYEALGKEKGLKRYKPTFIAKQEAKRLRQKLLEKGRSLGEEDSDSSEQEAS